MGSCVSRGPASAGSSGRRAATAKLVGLDGSMAQYAAPVTVREALGTDDASVFLCSSHELRVDAPPRALAGEEALQPGWLYFVLPASMLRLALSGHEMAALAVRASSALAVASGVIASPPRSKNVPGANGKQRKTTRVAPLVAHDEDAELVDGGARKTAHGGGSEKIGKRRAGYRSRGTRRRAPAPKLTAILEADDF